MEMRKQLAKFSKKNKAGDTTPRERDKEFILWQNGRRST